MECCVKPRTPLGSIRLRNSKSEIRKFPNALLFAPALPLTAFAVLTSDLCYSAGMLGCWQAGKPSRRDQTSEVKRQSKSEIRIPQSDMPHPSRLTPQVDRLVLSAE